MKQLFRLIKKRKKERIRKRLRKKNSTLRLIRIGTLVFLRGIRAYFRWRKDQDYILFFFKITRLQGYKVYAVWRYKCLEGCSAMNFNKFSNFHNLFYSKSFVFSVVLILLSSVILMFVSHNTCFGHKSRKNWPRMSWILDLFLM